MRKMAILAAAVTLSMAVVVPTGAASEHPPTIGELETVVSGLTVRTIHLHNHDLLIAKEPGQTNTPRPGALHTNLFHLAEPDQPAEKLLETSLIGTKRFDTQQSTLVINSHCHMGISVSVHTTSNTYDSHGRPFRIRPKGW